MNWVDFAVIVVWALAAFWGYKVGLVHMLFNVALVIVGIVAASRLAPSVGAVFSPLTEYEAAQRIIAFVVVLAVIFIIGFIAGKILRVGLAIVPLSGMVNGTAGAVVGLLGGFILLSSVLAAMQHFQLEALTRTIDESQLGAFLADQFSLVVKGVRIVPVDWGAAIDKVKDAA